MIFFKLLSYLALLIPVISYYKLRYGLALCLLFEILVPPLFNLHLIGLPVNTRIIYILVLIVLYIKLKNKNLKIDITVFRPYIILFVPLTIFTIFQSLTPLPVQWGNIIRVGMVTFLLPVIIWNTNRIDKGCIKFLVKILCVYIIIACVYGIFLTQMLGVNPYLILLYDIYSSEPYNLQYAAALGEGRLFGRIQSTFVHPMTWSLFLCFTFVLNYTFYSKEKKILYLITLLLIAINLIICGVRTGIVVISICVFIDLIRKKKFKTLVYIVLGILIIASIAIINNEEVQNYFISMIDFSGSKSHISGSSVEMRIEQLYGCFNIISDNPLFGNGYGWHSYYMSSNGDHPIVLAFESILFVIICNSGIVGIFIYLNFFCKIIKCKICKINKRDNLYLQMITFAYIGFAIITGEYDYLQQFAIYYCLLLCYLYNKVNIYEKY